MKIIMKYKTKNRKEKKNNKQNKSELRKNIQYLEHIENEKKWKCSIHNFNENKNSVYSHCLDSKCKSRAIYYLSPKEKKIINQLLIIL